ncbi:hypothetical protein POX_d05654 [Penicillium oxalicum]|uniref:hypothetical protein n=1 Tax=Penicillium oxalicum TaxID=69781 RepID=UPI0020B83DEF|nr:hypothetical protein POX_d05654 [Penicillium oxalicum]KAI2790149.1 hypothetical protein POX_d05654 [Penicillium oxalicum]
MAFFPKADGTILRPASSVVPPRPSRQTTVGPIYDLVNYENPIKPWSSDVEKTFYTKESTNLVTPIPEKPPTFSHRYLRAFLAENERLRLSVLWYYTRGILEEDELLAGLQEKAQLAQESTEWEFAVVGILDINVYSRLATVGLELGNLPRGETICAHTVTQPPGNVFLLPSLMEDWRFQKCPYLEDGKLHAYAGVPLRFKTESGPTVSLGSLCVASGQSREPLTKAEHQILVRLGDWIVADLVQCTRARRQRDRLRMSELLAQAQRQMDMNKTVSAAPIIDILRQVYPGAEIRVHPSRVTHVEFGGLDPISVEELEKGVWENTKYLDDFIANLNHLPTPTNQPARIISAPCDGVSGPCLLLVAINDFHHVFDDADAWFVQACAGVLSQMWRKSLLAEAMIAKEKFLRAFSHQLRTPIHGILGSVELLTEELKSRSLLGDSISTSAVEPVTSSERNHGEPSTYLDIIKMAGRDLTAIIDNLIMLNKWSDIAMAERIYKMHTFDELETEVANEIARFTSGDSRYTCSVFLDRKSQDEHLVKFFTDIAVLRDTLLPLVINALQHSPSGVVSITTSLSTDTKQLVVDIEDNGSGIPASDHERIFEAYEKVDSHSAGAGLGLTLASKFASLIDGSIELVSSEVGRGSHFRATFDQIHCGSVDSVPQPLAKSLGDMPLRFYQLLSDSDLCLADRFTSFLLHNGFSRSESPQNCLIVFEAEVDMDRHLKKLRQIDHDQVAICLIPEKRSPQRTERNVVYIRGPFRVSAYHAALQTALKYHQSRATHPRPPTLSQSKQLHNIPLTSREETKNTTETGSSLVTLNQPSHSVLDTAQPHLNEAYLENPITLSSLTLSSPRSTSHPMTLIVDDNFVNLRIMESYCSKRKLPYLSAVNGRQAVEIFTKHQTQQSSGLGPQIEMIFMDLQMPVCGGIEATRQIRQLESSNNWIKSAVFVMTGQDSPSDREATELAGVDEYFVKPVIVKQLDLIVKKHFPAFAGS